MFDAVKVDLSAAANRAARAKPSDVVVRDAADDDEGVATGKGTSSLQRREMLDRQSHLARKVHVRRMVAKTSDGGTLWQIAAGLVVVIACVALLTGGFEKASGGRRGMDHSASLPYGDLDEGEIGASWTTQRVCRHFGAPTPSRVRFAFGIDHPDALVEAVQAWRRVDIVQVNVGFRRNGEAGEDEDVRGDWRRRAREAFTNGVGASSDGVPAVVTKTPYEASMSSFTFSSFLETFATLQLASEQPVGREQGLMVTFVDPRAIEPGLRVARSYSRRGKLPGPLVVDGEILPGPGGFLSQLGSVFASAPSRDNSRARAAADRPPLELPVPGDPDEKARGTREGLTLGFDPAVDFVEQVKKYLPGSVLSVRWSAHGGCVDGAVAAEARRAYSKWYDDARGSAFDAPFRATSRIGFDANAAALRNEATRISSPEGVLRYDDAMMHDAYWVLRNATWRGDAMFGFEACALASPDPDGDVSDPYPYKKLVQQKLGWTAFLFGAADDDALRFLRGERGMETGEATHGSNRGAPEAATTFVGEVRRRFPPGSNPAVSPPLPPTRVLTATRLGARLAAAEGNREGDDDGAL
jgi:hypothetical protein